MEAKGSMLDKEFLHELAWCEAKTSGNKQELPSYHPEILSQPDCLQSTLAANSAATSFGGSKDAFLWSSALLT